MSLRLERENEDAVVSVGPCAETFNIVSNDHRHMQICGFSAFGRKYPLCINLVCKIEIVSLSWNLVPRLIWLCRIQWLCSLLKMFVWKRSLSWDLLPTVVRWVFGAGSGFGVGWRTGGGGLFRGFFCSVGGTFILVGGLGTGLSFNGVLRLAWYFLLS